MLTETIPVKDKYLRSTPAKRLNDTKYRDQDRIMTVFLEFKSDHVFIHDLIHEREALRGLIASFSNKLLYWQQAGINHQTLIRYDNRKCNIH
jgi:hypothetical protein